MQDFDAEINAVDGVVDFQGAGALGAGGDDALAIGTLQHAVLEAITRRVLPEAPDPDVPFAARATHAVAWPPDAEYESILARCAAAEARERGISLPGHARVCG